MQRGRGGIGGDQNLNGGPPQPWPPMMQMQMQQFARNAQPLPGMFPGTTPQFAPGRGAGGMLPGGMQQLPSMDRLAGHQQQQQQQQLGQQQRQPLPCSVDMQKAMMASALAKGSAGVGFWH
ncbi:hypothetical protein T484DRAFT_1917529 [Baffinella frigidus]|nr:hypothetical protein T484DRAFT_1917529 [Cryptophyta sp. CCMP2293]